MRGERSERRSADDGVHVNHYLVAEKSEFPRTSGFHDNSIFTHNAILQESIDLN